MPLFLTLVCSATLHAQEACKAELENFIHAYRTLDETGVGQWSDLDPLAAEAHRCFGDARTSDHAQVFDYETSILVRQRRFADALEVFERYFRDYAAVALPKDVPLMHVRRGYVYGQLGWTAPMLNEYTLASALAEPLPARNSAWIFLDTGEQYRLVGEYETAQRYLLAAESLMVRHFDEDPEYYGPRLGMVRRIRAIVLMTAVGPGRQAERTAADAAAPLMESALALIPANPRYAFYRAHALLWMAELHRMRDEPEQALASLAQIEPLRPWFQSVYPQMLAYAPQREGKIHLRAGNLAQAHRAFQLAADRAREHRIHNEEWRGLVGLGNVAEAEAAAGKEDALRAAEGYYRRAVAQVEEIREGHGLQEWSTASWEVLQEPYRHLARVLLRQRRPEEAFLVLDGTRARYLRDVRSTTERRDRLDARTAERLAVLAAAQDSARADLADPALPLGRRAALTQRQMALQQEMDAITGLTRVPTDTLTVPQVQEALRRRNQVLVTYLLDDDFPAAFVVRPDTFAFSPLSTTAEALQAEVNALGPLWTEGTADAAVRLTPLHRLYQMLVAPVAPLLPAGASLVVIPDGPLAQVPFGLLLERDHPPFAYADAPYLLRRHAVSVELAAALLAKPPEARDLPLDLLALGRSRYGGAPAAGRATRASAPLIDLPNVAAELRCIARRVGRGRIALDEEASEAYLSEYLGEARVIHLASHAIVDPQLPLYSRVLLWDDPVGDDDGTLYLYELQNRSLDADLVTLSGCGTARGRERIGEGMIGLQYAFRAAGARATLATLWQVDDAATVTLMDRFYLHLRRGLPKDEALRQAQLDYLASHDGLQASPFFWAAPVLYGDPASIPLSPGAPPPALWVSLGLFLVATGVAVPRVARRMRDRRSESA